MVMEADGIRYEIKGRTILSSIYLKCETGVVVGLVGRNGAGKSCLMNAIYGTLKCIEKSIRFDGLNLSTPFKRTDLIRFLPSYNFLPKWMTVKKVLRFFNLDAKSFEELFDDFKEFLNCKVGSLSAGQIRLLELYCILKSRTAFVLLDEPFLFLSPIHIEAVVEIIKIEKSNKGILITDHQYSYVQEMSDKLYFLDSGVTHVINDRSEISDFLYLPDRSK